MSKRTVNNSNRSIEVQRIRLKTIEPQSNLHLDSNQLNIVFPFHSHNAILSDLRIVKR